MVEITITGTGIVSALGTDCADFHRRMQAGETAIKASPWTGEVGIGQCRMVPRVRAQA